MIYLWSDTDQDQYLSIDFNFELKYDTWYSWTVSDINCRHNISIILIIGNQNIHNWQSSLIRIMLQRYLWEKKPLHVICSITQSMSFHLLCLCCGYNGLMIEEWYSLQYIYKPFYLWQSKLYMYMTKFNISLFLIIGILLQRCSRNKLLLEITLHVIYSINQSILFHLLWSLCCGYIGLMDDKCFIENE